MPDYLDDAWVQLCTSSELALGWATSNADTAEAWEIRIAAAEVVDVFQQVGLSSRRLSAELPSPGLAKRAKSMKAATTSSKVPPPATSLPPALARSLRAAERDLQGHQSAEATQAQTIPVDASQWRYDLYGGDYEAAKQDDLRRQGALARALADQATDLRQGLTALDQRLALQRRQPSWLSAAVPPDPPAAPASGAGDPGQRYRDQADKLRGRVDTFGKALGTLGTTLVTAAGISRIDGLYPIQSGDSKFVVGAVASLVLGLATVLWIALRLNKVANPISLRSDLDDLVAMNEITRPESRRVGEVYRRTYELNNATSLLAYELRGLRLQRIHGWIGDSSAAKVCADRATEITADVSVTLARASTVLVRRRATHALAGGIAPMLYGAFVAAIVGFALCSGKLTSDQTGRIAIVKSCGDAKAALNAAGTATTTSVSTVPDARATSPTTPSANTSTGSVTNTTSSVSPSTTTVTTVRISPASGLAGVPLICKDGQ